MQHKKLLAVLVCLIILLAATTSLTGILSKSGEGEFSFTSIHGQIVQIYGKGIVFHTNPNNAYLCNNQVKYS